MKANAILFNNFLGFTFEEFSETKKIADLCFDTNESMTEFYEAGIDKGIKAIKIESNESPKSYLLQYSVTDKKTFESLKLLAVELTMNS